MVKNNISERLYVLCIGHWKLSNLEAGELCITSEDLTLESLLVLAIGDINNDNSNELITINKARTLTVSNLGVFTPAQLTLQDRPTAAVIVDFNGDAFNDVAVVSEFGGSVSVMLNDGAGALLAPQTFAAGQAPSSIAAGDLDGDADSDLLVTNQNANEVSVLFNADGAFTDTLRLKVGATPLSAVVADVNGDSLLDIVTSNFNGSNASILINTGDGFLPQQVVGVGGFPLTIAAGDTDGDGDIDLAFGNLGFPQLSFLLNNGDGAFEVSSLLFLEASPRTLLLRDIDQDSRLDIVISFLSGVGVLLKQENDTFSDMIEFSLGDEVHITASGDLNGDADLDLVIATDKSSSIFSQTP